MGMRGLTGLLFVLALGGCASHVDTTARFAPPDMAAVTAGAAQCAPQPSSGATQNPIKWPPNDGFAGQPSPQVLMPGTLLDRFGGTCGFYFSPKGAPFQQRSLNTVCEQQTYTVYRVSSPLPVKAGTAAPWFDQPGGATQFETNAPVYLLIAYHVLEPVPDAGPKPCK